MIGIGRARVVVLMARVAIHRRIGVVPVCVTLWAAYGRVHSRQRVAGIRGVIEARILPVHGRMAN